MSDKLQEIKEAHREITPSPVWVRADVAWLIARVEKLEAALRCYAEFDYSHRVNAQNHAVHDSGKKAREALDD